MRSTITISLPDNLKEEIDRLAKQEGVSRSNIVRDAMRDYLFVRSFRTLRSRMMARAQAKGPFTDEDVFKEVSHTGRNP
jgi:CopG family transcriptional regulator/antitoxin EndoAI